MHRSMSSNSKRSKKKIKLVISLSVPLRKVESALKVSYMLNVDQVKHEKQTDGTGERAKLQALATLLNSG